MPINSVNTLSNYRTQIGKFNTNKKEDLQKKTLEKAIARSSYYSSRYERYNTHSVNYHKLLLCATAITLIAPTVYAGNDITSYVPVTKSKDVYCKKSLFCEQNKFIQTRSKRDYKYGISCEGFKKDFLHKKNKCSTKNTLLTITTKTILNPLLWNESCQLHKDVRKALIKISESWMKFCKIPKKSIKDLIVSGGSAGFHYTDFSDIDLHFIINKDEFFCDGIIDEYLLLKKDMWLKTRNVKVKGLTVEPFAQDYKDSFLKSQGVFSVYSNKWIQEPSTKKVESYTKKVTKLLNKLKDEIDLIINSEGATIEDFDELKTKIKKLRFNSIQTDGEFGIGNLVFKELRNAGYLEKVSKSRRILKDKELSLN